MDSDASFRVSNIQTCLMITQMYNVCNFDQHDASKTLSIANQSENSIEQYSSVTCFSSKDTKSSYFKIPFNVANNKHSILGTLFFEKHIQKRFIQGFT